MLTLPYFPLRRVAKGGLDGGLSGMARFGDNGSPSLTERPAMIKPVAQSVLMALLVLTAPPLHAWGQTGHRSIAEIAEQHMRPDSVRKAHALLDGHDLAFASTWGDEIRSRPAQFGHTLNWHYTTWPDDEDHFGADEEDKGSGLLLSQIAAQLAILENPQAGKAERSQALKFVIHLVGDVHQPLHVGAAGDKGGNACRVTWHGRNSNLHTVWDSDMIDKTQLSYTELADFASQSRTPQQTRAWRTGNAEAWAAESKALRSRIYPAEVLTPTTPLSHLTYCGPSVAPEAMPALGYEYSERFLPALYDRLYQAGIRLAMLLDAAL